MPEQCDVRLGLRKLLYGDATLRADDSAPCDSLDEQLIETIHDGMMSVSDRRHVDDLPIDELHSRIGREEAEFTHAVVFIHRDTVPR